MRFVVVLAALLLTACNGGPAAPRTPTPAATGAAGSSFDLFPTPSEAAVSAEPTPRAGPGRIAFSRLQSGDNVYTVFTINPDGTAARSIGAGTFAIPRWSPNGRLISISRDLVKFGSQTGSGSFLTIENADGTGVRDLARPDPSLSLTCTTWTPDSLILACEGWDPSRRGREGVYTVRATDGGGLVRLTAPAGGIHDVPGDFTPDGSKLVFVRATYTPVLLGELWECGADGANPTKLTDTLTGYRVSVSPDGHWVAGNANGALLIFDLTTLATEPRKITIPGGSASSPRWSPDGTQLVFQFVKKGATAPDIYIVQADGTNPRPLTLDPRRDEYPDWGP